MPFSSISRFFHRLFNAGPAEGSLRHFSAFEPYNEEFADNVIRTAKYTIWSFLPLNLWEQFHRLSNIYFLIIAILQFVPLISSVAPTTWIPLLFVLLVNMVKEGIEDRRRALQDKDINNKEVLHVDPECQAMQPLKWKDIRVGSVLVLKEDDPIPADVILLATADKTAGLAYIDTVQLDGETNLKSKESCEVAHRAFTADLPAGAQKNIKEVPQGHIALLRTLKVECEQPNDHLESFTGKLAGMDGQTEAITNKQVIYRGCTLRNTKWVYALVVYTGMESKLMKNSVAKKLKRTTLDKLSNQYVIGLFGLLFGLCFLASICSAIWIARHDEPRPWYLDEQYSIGQALGLNILTFLILMSSIIPLSLNVSAEVVKVFHARFINWDGQMVYDDPISGQPMPAKARTSNLGEDLGRIEYIFSDKTGTLTQNVMEFLKCSVAGVAYGTGTTEIGRAAAMRQGIVLKEDPRPANLKLERGDNFYDPRISFDSWQTRDDASAIQQFYLLLAVCHTVMAKPREGEEEDESMWTPENVAYQASSPDEEALVMGAKGQGFWFKRRNYRDCFVQIPSGETLCYKLLAVNEFSSTRKRMSVVVDAPDGKKLLMVKGADTVIFERLRPGALHHQETVGHLMDFANEGLRTLVLAQRELSEEECEEWKTKYNAAFQATADRDEKLDAVAEEIERDLELVGATAIEDKLQEGVPSTIRTLRAAGIQIWILTGDKVETAINIAMACNLIHPAMYLAKITLPDVLPGAGKEPGMEQAPRQLVDQQFRDALTHCKGASAERALVIDGLSLKCALEQEAEAGAADGLMLQFTNRCSSVVCSRVSPKQKADVVSLVRTKHQRITLAVGDGANDVSMILKAHIGVGISGREGQQAAMSSDFSIAQFRFLQNLILVHGRWSLQRVSLLICFCFYKNIGFSMIMFWFGLYSAYAGLNFYDDFYLSMWNVIFTSLPIMFVTVFNKDVHFQTTLIEFPEMYMDVQKGQPFTRTVFGLWCLDSISTGLAAFFIILYAIEDTSAQSKGLDNGWWLTSFTSYAALATMINLRLWMDTKTWNLWVLFILVGSLVSFYVFSIMYQYLKPKSLFFVEGNIWLMLNDFWVIGRCWAAIALANIMTLFFPFVVWAWQETWKAPTKSREVIRFEAQTLNQQVRLGRHPGEETWAKLLALLRGHPNPTAQPASPPPAPPPLPQQTNEQALHQVTPAITPTNTLEEVPHCTFHNAVTDMEEPYLGYSFSAQRGEDPEVVDCTVPGGRLRYMDYPTVRPYPYLDINGHIVDRTAQPL